MVLEGVPGGGRIFDMVHERNAGIAVGQGTAENLGIMGTEPLHLPFQGLAGFFPPNSRILLGELAVQGILVDGRAQFGLVQQPAVVHVILAAVNLEVIEFGKLDAEQRDSVGTLGELDLREIDAEMGAGH